MKKNTIFSILFLLFFEIFLPTSVKAAPLSRELLRISPVILNISLSPGKTYSYQITVQNLSKNPLPVKVTLEDFQTDEDNGILEINPATRSPLLAWSTFDMSDILLSPLSTKKVTLTIKLPDTIPIGGYYGIVFFEPIFSYSSTENVPVHTKVGTLLLANIGNEDPKKIRAEIPTFTLNHLFYDNNPIEFNFKVKNIVLQHFSAKPIIQISPLFGKKERFEFEEKFIFPGKTRTWADSIHLAHYYNGFYNVKLIVSTGNGQQIIKEAYFFAFPMKIALIFFTLILLFTFIVRKKKNIINAFKVFVK